MVVDAAQSETQSEGRLTTSDSIDKAVTARAELLAAALRDIEAFDFARSAAVKAAEEKASAPVETTPVAAPAAPVAAIAGGPAPLASKPPEKSQDPFRSAWKQLAKAAPPSTSSSILGEAPPTGAPVTYLAEPVVAAANDFTASADFVASDADDEASRFPETAALTPAPITWSTETVPMATEPIATGPWVPPTSHAPAMPQPSGDPYGQSQPYGQTQPYGQAQYGQPQQFAPTMLAPGQLPPGTYPPIPKKRAVWPWILGAVFAVIILGAVAMISAVSVLGSKVKATFNNISNTLPVNAPVGAYDSSGYLTGELAPVAGTCGNNAEGSGSFQYADCSASHNAKVLRATSFLPSATDAEQAAFLEDCKTELRSWTADDQSDSQVWRITFDQASGSKMQVCFVRYPS